MKSILTNTNKEEIELIKKLDYDVSQEEENEFRQLCDKLYIAKPYIIQV
ncbi:MAG: hypothetical protein N2505_00360 [Endomicrobia bacterium]|nr:hypothetical protein [Endomicrobiia bacterium]